MKPAYYNEIDPYCCQWLRNLIAAGHIPAGDVDERDIRAVQPDDLRNYGQVHFFSGIGGFAYACRLAGWPDERPILTGGFPCQDISKAGKGRGLEGDRSGLWSEMFRLIRGTRPGFVLVENSSALRHRGMGSILSDLASIGFDAEWDCLSASDFAAEHERERIYIVSYPNLQHGKAGMGIFPFDKKTIRDARDCNRNAVWLETTRPTTGMVDGVSVHLVRRSASEGFGNALVPQVAAEIIRAMM